MKYCDEYAALLDLFVDGECTPEEAERVRKHLAVCEGCRTYVADAYAIREAFPTFEDTQVPEGFADAVCAAVRADAAPRKKKNRWVKVVLSLTACAAVIAAAAQLAPLYGGGSTAASTASSAADSAETEERKSSGMQEFAALGAPDTGSVESGTQSAGTSDSGAAGNNQTLMADTVQPSQSGTDGLAPKEGADLYTAQSEAGEKRYAQWISVTKAEIGTLLDGYVGTQSFDSVSGETFTRYELSREDFEAILAQLKSPRVTVDDNAGTELCCIAVYP